MPVITRKKAKICGEVKKSARPLPLQNITNSPKVSSKSSKNKKLIKNKIEVHSPLLVVELKRVFKRNPEKTAMNDANELEEDTLSGEAPIEYKTVSNSNGEVALKIDENVKCEKTSEIKAEQIESTTEQVVHSKSPEKPSEATKSPSNQKRKVSTNDYDGAIKQSKLESPAHDQLPNSKSHEKRRKGKDCVLELYIQLEAILGEKYTNVVDRLKLNFVPLCYKNMENCRTVHSKKAPNPTTANIYQIYQTKALFSQSFQLNGLKMCEDMCHRNEFPGEELFTSIIHLILTTNDSSDMSFFDRHIIQQSAILFRSLLAKFPPCWQAMRPFYEKFLTEPIDVEKILPDKCRSGNVNIFQFILSLLEKTISEREDDKVSKRSATDILNDSEMFNYNEWEKNQEKHFFSILTRTDKLDRLFLVLDLLTRVLEQDLAIWILRHPFNPKKHLSDEREHPLVVPLFSLTDYNYITPLVKNIFQLFVNCVCFSYPEDKIEIFSRLISVLSVVTNIRETELIMDKMKYPFIGTKTENFAKELFKTVDNFSLTGRNVKNFLSVFEYIKIPYIKYLLIDQFLSKFDLDHTPMNPEKIATNFYKKRWLGCLPDSEKIPEAKMANIPMRQKYPIVTTISKKSSRGCDIHRQEYLKILLDALKAYCDTFEVRRAAQVVAGPSTESPAETKSFSPSMLSEVKCDQNPINLESIEESIAQFEASFDLKAKRLPHTEKPSYDRISVDQSTLISYRRDTKYLMVLRKHMSKWCKEYDEDFTDWNSFLNDIFERPSY